LDGRTEGESSEHHERLVGVLLSCFLDFKLMMGFSPLTELVYRAAGWCVERQARAGGRMKRQGD
jgi:hypothetical protein